MTLPRVFAPRSAWWGNEAVDWAAAALGAALGVLVVYAAVWVVRRRMVPRAQAGSSAMVRGLAEALGSVRLRLLVPIAIVVAADFLSFPPRVDFWLRIITFALVGLQILLCVNRLIVGAVRYWVKPAPGGQAPVMLSIVTWALQLVVWLTFLLALLAAGGVNITAFVASLGVGGIAVALALQNILGDLFASISIGLDKPFEPGDAIAFDTGEGTVAHIGVKSTRIMSQTGEELSIGNAQLLQKLTHNYSRMPQRRVVFGFTVPYTTGREQLQQIVDRVNGMIADIDGVRFDRGHLTGFGPDGFTVEFVYHLPDSDFARYRAIQQQINYQIIDLLADLDVPFAGVPRRGDPARPPSPGSGPSTR